MDSMAYKSIAVDVGDLIKGTSSNEIGRAAITTFRFNHQKFPPEDSITSKTAHLFYEWVMTLAKQKMNIEERNDLLIKFCKKVASKEQFDKIDEIFKDAGIKLASHQEPVHDFNLRGFHEQIHKHSKEPFKNKNYSFAALEAVKSYEKSVQKKSESNLDGQKLMQNVWAFKDGVLKITECKSKTDENIQNGMGFLSAGLIKVIRNPAAHELETDWKITKDECLDILSFINFLFKKLDDAVYISRS